MLLAQFNVQKELFAPETKLKDGLSYSCLSIQVMYIKIGIIIFTILLSDQAMAQASDSSLHEIVHKRPSIFIQFLAGNAGYTIPFWSLGGKKYIETGDQNLASVFLGFIGAGVAVSLSGNLLCDCHGSYWAGIGGAFFGAIIAGPLYRYVGDHTASIPLQYFALSLPPVIMSILLYQIVLEDDYYDHSSKEIFISPSLSKSFFGVNFGVNF